MFAASFCSNVAQWNNSQLALAWDPWIQHIASYYFNINIITKVLFGNRYIDSTILHICGPSRKFDDAFPSAEHFVRNRINQHILQHAQALFGWHIRPIQAIKADTDYDSHSEPQYTLVILGYKLHFVASQDAIPGGCCVFFSRSALLEFPLSAATGLRAKLRPKIHWWSNVGMTTPLRCDVDRIANMLTWWILSVGKITDRGCASPSGCGTNGASIPPGGMNSNRAISVRCADFPKEFAATWQAKPSMPQLHPDRFCEKCLLCDCRPVFFLAILRRHKHHHPCCE